MSNISLPSVRDCRGRCHHHPVQVHFFQQAWSTNHHFLGRKTSSERLKGQWLNMQHHGLSKQTVRVQPEIQKTAKFWLLHRVCFNRVGGLKNVEPQPFFPSGKYDLEGRVHLRSRTNKSMINLQIVTDKNHTEKAWKRYTVLNPLPKLSSLRQPKFPVDLVSSLPLDLYRARDRRGSAPKTSSAVANGQILSSIKGWSIVQQTNKHQESIV